MSTALSAARTKTKGKRMLRNALDAYGDEDTSLSKWNARKKQAVEEGKWLWKDSVVSANAALKVRFDREDVRSTVKTRFGDVQAAMEEEMSNTIHVDQHGGQLLIASDRQCCWRERIGGKVYHCNNVLPSDKKKNVETKRFCLWHVKECAYDEHPTDKSRVIEVANEFGMCLHCYESTAGRLRATLQKVPPRLGVLQTPGVCETNTRKEIKRDVMMKLPLQRAAEPRRNLTPRSLCAWHKEHSEKSYVWRCTNLVLMHPNLQGSCLPFCGFHAVQCIQTYGTKARTCPPIDRKNRLGMCHNHLEAYLTSLSFEERGSIELIDSEFDVPGIKECKREEVVAPIQRHPLAPKCPPPNSMEFTHAVVVLPSHPRRSLLHKIIKNVRVLTTTTINQVLNHPNAVSNVVKDALWRLQFIRRAELVATRIQSIFRGNRARRRVKLLRYEHAAIYRIAACRVLQRFVRGFIGRRKFENEHERVHNAVPHIQRLLRGALARKKFRELCAALRLQRNFRLYRQRILGRTIREEVAYMQALQRQAEVNYTDMETQLITFRRLRAYRILRAHITQWKRRQDVYEQEMAARLRSLVGTVKIQRQWRRYYRYKGVKQRYESAIRIQKHARGWLTRRLWRGDPGVHFVASFINPCNGFKYGKIVIKSQSSGSYSVPSRKIRTQCGVMTIQRVFRGFIGRLTANSCWVAMLRRWEWLGITPTDARGQLSDSMTVGRERYALLLPSFAYHKDRSQHMRSVATDRVVNRGHAYKYQYILDLIKDRDGQRGWSLAREEMYAKQWEEEQQWLHTEQARREAKEAEIASKELRRHVVKKRDPLAQSISISKALLPVGTCVDVVGKMEGERIIRRAKITAIHQQIEMNGERNVRFDVQYTKTQRSSFGRLEASNEQRVELTRLRHVPLVRSKRNPNTNVGGVIQTAIDCLRREIQSNVSFQAGDTAVNEALPSVDAIADRLRDCREGHDLLRDHRDFVDFVFKNSTLLQLKWPQVVSHIRYGTRVAKLTPMATVKSLPRAPLMEMLHREFGLDRSKTTQAMPARAHAIEEKMAKLGFQYDTQVNVQRHGRRNSPEEEQSERSTRPETTPMFTESPLRRMIPDTVDDMMLFREDSTPPNAQDLHRLIYELKTLPREARSEQIIHVASRRSHAFVCGHPACGKCFSSRKMARLHQVQTHEGRERLASGNPVVDQYLHSYWPREAPWTTTDHKMMVGFFPCRHKGCETLQLRTRRELTRHHATKHGVKDRTLSSYCTTPSPLRIETEELSSTKRSKPFQNIIWLGPYVVCRNLEAKLGITAAMLTTPKPCSVHDTAVQLCTTCFLQQRRPVSPFRLYSAFAAHGSLRIEAGEEEYTIFRDDDEAFCPAVNIWGVFSLTTSSKRKEKDKVTLPDPLSSVLYLQVTTICRDAQGEAWIFGHVLAHRKHSGSRREEGDEYEVVPDKDRGLVFALASQVVGSASIHYCSKTVFYRKHHAKDEESEAITCTTSSKRGNTFPRNLFCRPSYSSQLTQEE
ncbi:IQ calmodulin binding motif-containing protein [Phytophthora infestans]|uniref:IQ calmodulin binding motif-containing protein n=1 Tax=Phytophthora infestans TaxID=4787 RepID=A0A833T222_PHYIN|nr:IQ calmodulin binding motif-containing protein [Phytophthora infestans]